MTVFLASSLNDVQVPAPGIPAKCTHGPSITNKRLLCSTTDHRQHSNDDYVTIAPPPIHYTTHLPGA